MLFFGFPFLYIPKMSTERFYCSVAKSCLPLCTPGFPCLSVSPEFVQTLVHRIGVAIQPCHPLLPPSAPALNLSRFLFLYEGICLWQKSGNESQTSMNSYLLEKWEGRALTFLACEIQHLPGPSPCLALVFLKWLETHETPGSWAAPAAAGGEGGTCWPLLFFWAEGNQGLPASAALGFQPAGSAFL